MGLIEIYIRLPWDSW